MYSLTCHVYVYASYQNGFQPIHFAASNGHADLLISLINNFEVDPQEKTDVRGMLSYCNNCVFCSLWLWRDRESALKNTEPKSQLFTLKLSDSQFQISTNCIDHDYQTKNHAVNFFYVVQHTAIAHSCRSWSAGYCSTFVGWVQSASKCNSTGMHNHRAVYYIDLMNQLTATIF